MQRSSFSFLLVLALVLGGVLSNDFQLTYQRVRGNTLILQCTSPTNYTSTKYVSFWVNNTEVIDILHGLQPEDAALQITQGETENVISFVLRPQYEGTFYCGEIDGESSNGVGPMAGNNIMLVGQYIVLAP